MKPPHPDELYGKVVIDGRTYPACRFCNVRISSFYRGANPSGDVLAATVRRYMDHLWAEHPDRVDEVVALFKEEG